jgi:carbon monoxide dehydrogenase subunit G
MQLSNEFVVDASADETWALLTDLERVAPCMPGAAMTGRDGDRYLGTVKIKVGPIGAHFAGTAQFLEQDHAAHTATISMAGKDAKGAAAANATIRARLEPLGPTSTRVFVDTDLDISGRMAQFGRGAIADVSNRLIGQFTTNLSAEIMGGGTPVAAPAGAVTAAAGSGANGTSAAAAPRPVAGQPVSSDLNVMELIGPGLLKEIGRPMLFFALGYLVARAYPRKRGQR